jgi:hypothetical protein
MEHKTATKYYYDSHHNDAWCMKFAVLFIDESHRKILNRRPDIYTIKINNTLLEIIIIDFKELSN